MRALGLIGGTAWRSTVQYYTLMNAAVNEHFGDNTNPPLVIANLNHAAIHACQREDDWGGVTDILTEAAERLRGAGVEALMVGANTAHRVTDEVAERVGLPFIHIGDATGRTLREAGLETAGFIGTRFSMEGTFITDRIEAEGVKVLVPDDPSVLAEMQRIVLEEISRGEFRPASREYMTNVLRELVAKGAEGAVLGCTEYPLLFEGVESGIRLFDSTEIHARAGVDFMLS